MRLTELELGKEEEILADAEFDYFGLLSSNTVNNVLSFLDNKEFTVQLANKKIKCLICKKEFISILPEHIEGIIVSENPMLLFWKLYNSIGNCRKQFITRIGENSIISPLAAIAQNNVVIGNNVIIEDFVSIKENVQIGNNVIIRSGSVIGGSGFEEKKVENGILSINHFGGVIIEDNVEIQQMVSVEKAIFPWDDTIIGMNTKIADMSIVAHCCKLGKNCLLSGRSTLCGSVIVNDNVWIGPEVIIVNGLTIGQDSYIVLGSIVRKSVASGMAVVNDKIMDVAKYKAIMNSHNSHS